MSNIDEEIDSIELNEDLDSTHGLNYREELTDDNLMIKIYAGGIREIDNCKLRVTIRDNLGSRKSYTYNINNYLSYDNMYEDAIKFMKLKSDETGNTKLVHASYYTRGMEIPIDVKSYIMGFFDGDGHIGISRSKNINSVNISFVQAHDTETCEILEFIRNYYGGNITHRQPGTVNSRHTSTLTLRARDHIHFIKDLAQYGVLKKCRAVLLLNGYYNGEKHNDPVWHEQMKMLVENTQNVELPSEPLPASYLAGLYDAEGCVRINKHGAIFSTLTQKSCIRILDLIKRTYGGCVTDGGLKTSNSSSIVLFESIIPFSIIKREQIQIALDYRKWLSTMKQPYKYNKEVQERITEVRAKLTALKKT